MAIPRRKRRTPRRRGGDLAGFPNGRRLADDVVTIELKAIAGATYPLIDPTYVPTRRSESSTRLTTSATDQTAKAPRATCGLPYLGTPHSGYEVPAA